jgi:inorganic pyrophosphatase
VLLEVVIEVPRYSFVKRDAGGKLDFVSPLPSPFNYGCVPETLAPDGAEVDAIVLGPRKPRGARIALPARAKVLFIDEGVEDFKWVCAEAPLSILDRARIAAFFRVYVAFKRGLARVRGRDGAIDYRGLQVIAG